MWVIVTLAFFVPGCCFDLKKAKWRVREKEEKIWTNKRRNSLSSCILQRLNILKHWLRMFSY